MIGNYFKKWFYRKKHTVKDGHILSTVILMVVTERIRQKKLWGEQDHDAPFWLSILGEEFGEVCRAVYEGKTDEYVTELVHVAAVAVQMIECELRRGYGKGKCEEAAG